MKFPKFVRDSSSLPLSVRLVMMRNLCLQFVFILAVVYFVMPGRDYRGGKFLRAVIATNLCMVGFHVFSDRRSG